MVADNALTRTAPETLTAFRLGQLLLLLAEAADQQQGALTVDRLGIYDFLAGNPFLVIDPHSTDGRSLLVSGFEFWNLDYQSSGQRFANRRARLQHDLAMLTAYGLAVVAPAGGRIGYEVTPRGTEATNRLLALYAIAYRTSASLIIRRLKRLSDTRLRSEATQWLQADSLLIELYD